MHFLLFWRFCGNAVYSTFQLLLIFKVETDFSIKFNMAPINEVVPTEIMRDTQSLGFYINKFSHFQLLFSCNWITFVNFSERKSEYKVAKRFSSQIVQLGKKWTQFHDRGHLLCEYLGRILEKSLMWGTDALSLPSNNRWVIVQLVNHQIKCHVFNFAKKFNFHLTSYNT